MNKNTAMDNARVIQRFDVETPLGVVHLAGFMQKPDHRSVVFEILSQFSGETVTAADLVESKENPRPSFPKLDFDVNWTHSNGFCVLAYGDRGSRSKMRLGVDMERFLQKRLHLADRFFSAEEAALIKSLGADAAEQEFFKLWCRKEAFYKCIGGEFFEGTLRRNMLKSPVLLEASGHEVHFVDLDAAVVGMPTPAALCVAVSSL